MTFNNIIGNFPYGKIGCDITNFILKYIPYNDISMLGTRAMFRKHNDVLNIEYVYITNWVLNPISKIKWVEQLILLGHKGHCEVVPTKVFNHHSPEHPNEIRVAFSMETTGEIRAFINTLLTRSRKTSRILCLSDGDYEYNVLKTLNTIPTITDKAGERLSYHCLDLKGKAHENFGIWWYCNNGDNLSVFLMKSLNKNGGSCESVIPQIDWETISDTQLWKEGKYDEAVLDVMDLKWDGEEIVETMKPYL